MIAPLCIETVQVSLLSHPFLSLEKSKLLLDQVHISNWTMTSRLCS